ncbi:MAG: tyrosine--tRNA ligase [Gemmatimonadetes bacterium]|nr:tyrosine--tRNA ligase [Gemmatimonadota bacterium]
MPLYEELAWRGFIENKTSEELPKILADGKITAYDGFDPTADSLHVGNLVGIMALVHFQRHGHKPVVLMGGATGMIGDPSGKSKERVLLTTEAIESNVAKQKAQFEHFLDFDGGKALLVNNASWFAPITFIDFLRDVGKHFRLGEMLAKESVKSRLNSDVGISYTEFSYMLLQSYDFLHLHDAHGCTMQIGGSDQWGNITAGIDLIRKLRSAQAYGLTTPLITDSTGQKLGKTAEGENVWLDPKRTSPYKFYQYWVNQPDSDVVRFLKLFTLLEQDEITALEKCVADEPHKREAQKRLAHVTTEMVHGADGLAAAEKATAIMFGGAIEDVDGDTLLDIFADVPSATLAPAYLDDGQTIVDLLVDSKTAKSRGDARRRVKEGGIYLNNVRVQEEGRAITREDLVADTAIVIRAGKKNYRVVRFG